MKGKTLHFSQKLLLLSPATTGVEPFLKWEGFEVVPTSIRFESFDYSSVLLFPARGLGWAGVLFPSGMQRRRCRYGMDA